MQHNVQSDAGVTRVSHKIQQQYKSQRTFKTARRAAPDKVMDARSAHRAILNLMEDKKDTKGYNLYLNLSAMHRRHGPRSKRRPVEHGGCTFLHFLEI